MYTAFYQMHKYPFELTPDPRFVYLSEAHEQALIRLLYTVRQHKGAMLLTGHYGCGKTVLSRVFLDKLRQGPYEVALITNPCFQAHEMMHEVVYQLGGERDSRATEAGMLQVFHEIIFSNLSRGRETVVVIDEAQVIQDLKTFEALRLLLNFQQNDRFLLTLILIGQEDVWQKINEIPQFKQRLIINYHLGALNEVESYRYINHRLKVAGASREVFSLEAKQFIYNYAGGIPRVINAVADLALFKGYERRQRVVDELVVREALPQKVLESVWSV